LPTSPLKVDTSQPATYMGGSNGVVQFTNRLTRREQFMSTVKVTDESFEKDVLQASGPVLVDFWAEWCGPCKMMSPILDQLATEQAGRATIAKVDIDAFPDLQARFGIRAIPTLIVFKNGQPVNTITGVKSKGFLEAALAA
jgi:thioredoxin 1